MKVYLDDTTCFNFYIYRNCYFCLFLLHFNSFCNFYTILSRFSSYFDTTLHINLLFYSNFVSSYLSSSFFTTISSEKSIPVQAFSVEIPLRCGFCLEMMMSLDFSSKREIN